MGCLTFCASHIPEKIRSPRKSAVCSQPLKPGWNPKRDWEWPESEALGGFWPARRHRRLFLTGCWGNPGLLTPAGRCCYALLVTSLPPDARGPTDGNISLWNTKTGNSDSVRNKSSLRFFCTNASFKETLQPQSQLVSVISDHSVELYIILSTFIYIFSYWQILKSVTLNLIGRYLKQDDLDMGHLSWLPHGNSCSVCRLQPKVRDRVIRLSFVLLHSSEILCADRALARERTTGLSMMPLRKIRSMSLASVPNGSSFRLCNTCCMA